MMFKTVLALAASALCLSTVAAQASGERMTDAQYVAAQRCDALMSARSLGAVDSRAIDALVRQQEAGRTSMAYDRAQEAHDDAARQARVAGAYEKTQLAAERDGPCRAMLATTTLAKSN
jgi:hypothetical protein